MNQQDHLSKLLSIFGQNLTDSQIVQVKQLISDYNVGEYTHNLNMFKGKGPKDIKDISASIQGQARKDLTFALLHNTENYRNNFIKKHQNEMALYDQCNSEFSKAGKYGSQGTIDGKLTTFAARLTMIRGWGAAINETGNSSGAGETNTNAPGTISPNLDVPATTAPASGAPVDMELPDSIDGGQMGLLVDPIIEEIPAVKVPWKNNEFYLAYEEMKEIDAGWDITEDVVTLTKADIIPEENFEEITVLTEADIIADGSPEKIQIATREKIQEEIITLSEDDIIV
jgi:hypothetical protein